MSQDPSHTEEPLGRDGTLDDDLLAEELDYGLADGEDEGASWMLIIGILAAAGAISFLVFDGLQSETYFFDVHDAVERGDELVGETVRLRGDVEQGTLQSNPGELNHRFDIATQGESITVVYQKALPDTFEENSEVVTQGHLDDDFVLYADEVLVKCPSRYEGAPPTTDDPLGNYQETSPDDSAPDTTRASR